MSSESTGSHGGNGKDDIESQLPEVSFNEESEPRDEANPKRKSILRSSLNRVKFSLGLLPAEMKSRSRRSSTASEYEVRLRLRHGIIRTTTKESETKCNFTLVPDGYFGVQNRQTPTIQRVKNVLDALELEATDTLFEVPGNWSYVQFFPNSAELPPPYVVKEVLQASGTWDMLESDNIKDSLQQKFQRFTHTYEEWDETRHDWDGYLALIESDIMSLCEYGMAVLVDRLKETSRDWQRKYVSYLRKEEERMTRYLAQIKNAFSGEGDDDDDDDNDDKTSFVTGSFFQAVLDDSSTTKKGRVADTSRPERDRTGATSHSSSSNSLEIPSQFILDEILDEASELKQQHYQPRKTWKMYYKESQVRLHEIRDLLSSSSRRIDLMSVHLALSKLAKLNAKLKVKPIQKPKFNVGRLFANYCSPINNVTTTEDDAYMERMFEQYRDVARIYQKFRDRQLTIETKKSRIISVMKGLTKALSAGSMFLVSEPFNTGGIKGLLCNHAEAGSKILGLTTMDAFKDDNIKRSLYRAREFDPQNNYKLKVVEMSKEKIERQKNAGSNWSWLNEKLGDMTDEEGRRKCSDELLRRVRESALDDYGFTQGQTQLLLSGVSHLVVFESERDKRAFVCALRNCMLTGLLLFSGKGAWHEAVRAFKANAPLFVFNGSGGSADIFAQVVKHKESGRNRKKTMRDLSNKLEALRFSYSPRAYGMRKKEALVLARDWPENHNCVVINIEDSIERLQEKVTRVMSERYVSIETSELGAFQNNRKRLFDAWDNYNMFTQNRTYYLRVSTILRYIIAFKSIAATIAAILLNTPSVCPEEDTSTCDSLRYVATIMPILAAVLLGVEEVLQPMSNSQQLALAKRRLESEIYLFRSGAGPYTVGAIANSANKPSSPSKRDHDGGRTSHDTFDDDDGNEEDESSLPREIFASRIENIFMSVASLTLSGRSSSTGTMLDHRQKETLHVLKESIRRSHKGQALENKVADQWEERDTWQTDQDIDVKLAQDMKSVFQKFVPQRLKKSKRKGNDSDDDAWDEFNDESDEEQQCSSDRTSSGMFLGWSQVVTPKKIKECSPLYFTLSAEIYRRTRFEMVMSRLQHDNKVLQQTNLIYQILIIGTTTISGFFVVIGIESWIPLLLTISAILAGWRELQAVPHRLIIANKALSDMKQLQSWWNGLNTFQARMPTNMRHLVERTEEIYFSQVSFFSQVTQADVMEGPEKKNQ